MYLILILDICTDKINMEFSEISRNRIIKQTKNISKFGKHWTRFV